MKRIICLLTVVLCFFCSSCGKSEPDSNEPSLSTKYSSGIRLQPVNTIADCTDTDKLYVLPDGYIYAYYPVISPLPPIEMESAAKGFWYANEWHPDGGWKENDACCAKRTKLLSVVPGDILRYQGIGNANVPSVVWLDNAQQYLRTEFYDAATEPVNITVPEDAGFVWFGSFEYRNTPEHTLLNVSWLKCQSRTIENQWANTGLLSTNLESPILLDTYREICSLLQNKLIIYDGDSICADRTVSGRAYPAIIGSITGGQFENHAVPGARLCSSDSRHSVVENLVNLPAYGDLYCFEGGINDFCANTPIGECSPDDFTGAVDPATICGALETIFRYAKTHFPQKPIFFVITHQIQDTATKPNANGNTFQDYRNAMVMVCEKYGVAYYDAFTHSNLFGWNETHNRKYLTGNSDFTPDGTHPNEDGYRGYYVPQLLTEFHKVFF